MNEDPKIKVNLYGVELEIRASDHWEMLSKLPFEDQLGQINSELHWLIVLHGIDRPQEAKDRFWSNFNSDGATANREKAIHGLKSSNYSEEIELLDRAMFAKTVRDLAIQDNEPLGEIYGNPTLGFLGDALIGLIENRDHKAFSRLADLIKYGGIPESNRGGEDSELGQMYRNFCQLHTNTRGLPTKMELRKDCGMGSSDKDFKKAGTMMKKLGLSGLPERW